MSSALDLAETIHTLGFDLHVGLIGGHIYYKVRGKKFCPTTIPDSCIHTIPSQYTRVEKHPGEQGIKSAFRKRLKSFTESNRRFTNLLKHADLIIEAASLTGASVEELKKQTKAPVIYNHASSPDQIQNWLHLIDRSSSMKPKDRYVEFCKQFDGMLFQARDQAEEYLKRSGTSNNSEYVLPPSCQEKSVLRSLQSNTPFSAGSRNIVVIGSILRRKAQHLSIEAFSALCSDYPDLFLHFVGGNLSSEYGKELKVIVDEKGLQKNVLFHGHRKDYLRFMAHADVILQTSRMEGVSRILREAMLLKRPIVSFDIPGTRSILDAGKEAFLVELDNLDGVAEALRSILSDSAIGEKLAESAFQKYLSNHSWPVYASNVREMVYALSDRRKR